MQAEFLRPITERMVLAAGHEGVLGRGAGDASLKMPMLAIGGAWSLGEAVMRSLD